MKLFALALSSLLLGCASDSFAPDPARPGLPPLTIGIWPNPYHNDPNLAAVSIVDRPADPFDRRGFIYRQPATIWYAFWDGRVRQIDYRPDGSILESFWWSPKEWLKGGSSAWGGFNFAYGSDPTFARHRDPRLRDAPAPVVPGRS